MRPFASMLALVAITAIGLPGTAIADVGDVQISEIRIDQPGADLDEFFELTGPAGQSLDGLTYLVIGDGTGGSGVIEEATGLTGSTIHTDGTFIAAESTFSLGAVDLTTDLDFENSDNVTHLLVQGFTGSNGDDLDTDDDGTLDVIPWTAVIDGLALIEDLSSGEQVYSATQVGPDGSFVPGHVYRDASGTWQIGAFGGGDETVRPAATDPCDTTYTVPEVQGSGDSTPLAGQTFSTTGVVTNAGGSYFWMQDPVGDGDPATSDGIYVYKGGASVTIPYLDPGDQVTVCGTATEYRGLTQIGSVRAFERSATGVVVQPIDFSLPAPRDLESYEGMLLDIEQRWYVTDLYDALAYDEAWFSGEAPLRIPTDLFAPGSPAAQALAVENMRNQLEVRLDWDLYDDLQASAGRFLRRGDAIDVDAFGTITEVYDDKQFFAFDGPSYVGAGDVVLLNDRPAVPDVGDADVVVASMNVYNYWTTVDYYTGYKDCVELHTDGDWEDFDVQAEAEPFCGPAPRGARSGAQFERQRAALADAINGLAADVVALQELETPGLNPREAEPDDPNETLIDLVGMLNEDAGAEVWDYVPVPDGFLDVNTNPIHSGFIYRPATVEWTGVSVALEELADVYDRLPVAATFAQGNQRFTVVNDHLKSKGCSGATGADADQGDGQSCFNATRVQQAEAVVDWVRELRSIGRTPRILVTGDLNSYAQEDPIDVLRDAELVDLAGTWLPTDDRYSYVFFGEGGSLDHAFATQPLANAVTGVDIWHTNADEAQGLAYFGQEPSLARWRAADHDPVVIGIDLPGKPR